MSARASQEPPPTSANGSGAHLPEAKPKDPATQSTPPTVRAGKDGFTLRASDDSFVLRVRGYVHSDARFYPDDAVKATDTFLLRRVRPTLEGTLYKQFDFRIMPDFGEGKSVLQDAYLEARFTPSFKLRAGKFKAPVGLERLASATDLLFVERALPTALVPNRDLGLMVSGDLRSATVAYAMGVFNGVPDGASADSDDHDGKDVAVRLFLLPFRNAAKHPLQGLGFGVSTTYGVQRGTASAAGLPAYKSGGQLTVFRYHADGTVANTVVADGARVRFSSQGYYYRGPWGLLFEHVVSAQNVERSGNTASLTNTAWQVQGSCLLTGEKAGYRRSSPTRNFDPDAGTWGAFELAVRLDAIDIDDAAFPIYANPSSAVSRVLAWTAGLNWYLNPSIKIVTNYERSTFTGGAREGNRPAEQAFFSRFQVAF